MNENGRLNTYPANQANYQTDVFTRKAVDVIRRRAPSDTPFFLWLTYFAPHSGAPLDDDDAPATGVTSGPSPAARHQNRFDQEPLPQPLSFDEADVADKPLFIRNRRRLTIGQVEAIQESYQQRLESLLAVDEGVAQVVRALRNTSELANTVIVFTSDNGFMHGEHRIPAGKSVVYEPSARVPLVIRGPQIPRARRVQDVVSNVDLAPTFLTLAQATPTLPLDGRSLLPLARDRLADFGRDLMLESNTYGAIHTQRYVYVEHRAGGRELYDLQGDRDELQSRHADPALARIRAELARRLALLRICLGTNCRQAPRLQLRLAAVTGRSVRAGVTGRDLSWVTRTRFYVAGKLVAADARAPFSVTLPGPLFGGPIATIRVHVRTLDGRGVTMTRKIPLPLAAAVAAGATRTAAPAAPLTSGRGVRHVPAEDDVPAIVVAVPRLLASLPEALPARVHEVDSRALPGRAEPDLDLGHLRPVLVPRVPGEDDPVRGLPHEDLAPVALLAAVEALEQPAALASLEDDGVDDGPLASGGHRVRLDRPPAVDAVGECRERLVDRRVDGDRLAHRLDLDLGAHSSSFAVSAAVLNAARASFQKLSK